MTGGWTVGTSAIGSAEYANQSIVICTGDGLVTLYLDETGNPIKDKDGKTLTTSCEWCVGFSTAPTLTAATNLLDFAPCDTGNLQFAQVSDKHNSQATISNARIRAPPVWVQS
jgi:WD40 repeat protein